MASFYGPAMAAGAFSKAVSDLMGGLLEGERNKGTIEEQEARRAAMQREAQMQAATMPFKIQGMQQDLEKGKLGMASERQKMQMAPWEQIQDQYGNIIERNRLTGETRPVLSGQTKTHISGRNIYTMGPEGMKVSPVPMSPQEEVAYKELGKANLLKNPADRTRFLENWMFTHGYNIDPKSPVLMMYREMMRAEEAKARTAAVGSGKGYVTTQEVETPRKPITDPMVRGQIKAQLIDPFTNRGPKGTDQSAADKRFPGFDNPKLPVELKEKALGLLLKEAGYEGTVKLVNTPQGPTFIITAIAYPNQVTERATTRRPLTPAELGGASYAPEE